MLYDTVGCNIPHQRREQIMRQIRQGTLIAERPLDKPELRTDLPAYLYIRRSTGAQKKDNLILPRISGRVKSSEILSRRRKRVMQKVQKTYTTEFKREAVHLAQTSGKPITQIARELGISDTSIHQWRKELTEHGPEAFPGSGHQTAQEEELRRLKRELERTQKERDILRKALAIFSQNPL